MNALFRDPERQREFESRGYVVLRFLDEPELERIASLYNSLTVQNLPHRFRSIGHESPDLLRRLRDEFETIASDALARLFVPCDVLLGNFLNKAPHPEGAVRPHRDWTIFNETEGSGATIWMPLAGVDLNMGALGVLPGSHRIFSDLGFAPSAQGYKVLPYADYAMELFPYLDFVALKPGEAVLFHGNAVHGSLPNVSTRTRITAVFSVVSKGSRMSLPYLLPNTDLTKFESFEINRDDFIEYHNAMLQEMFERGERPSQLVSRGVFDVQRTKVGVDEAIARIESAGGRRHALTS